MERLLGTPAGEAQVRTEFGPASGQFRVARVGSPMIIVSLLLADPPLVVVVPPPLTALEAAGELVLPLPDGTIGLQGLAPPNPLTAVPPTVAGAVGSRAPPAPPTAPLPHPLPLPLGVLLPPAAAGTTLVVGLGGCLISLMGLSFMPLPAPAASAFPPHSRVVPCMTRQCNHTSSRWAMSNPGMNAPTNLSMPCNGLTLSSTWPQSHGLILGASFALGSLLEASSGSLPSFPSIPMITGSGMTMLPSRRPSAYTLPTRPGLIMTWLLTCSSSVVFAWGI